MKTQKIGGLWPVLVIVVLLAIAASGAVHTATIPWTISSTGIVESVEMTDSGLELRLQAESAEATTAVVATGKVSPGETVTVECRRTSPLPPFMRQQECRLVETPSE